MATAAHILPHDNAPFHHAFQQAFRFVHALPTDPQGMKEVSPEQRLELYGLWLQTNYGVCPDHKNPYPWARIQREKWEAWKKVGNLTKDEAKEVFITKVVQILKNSPTTRTRQDLLYLLERRKKSPVIIYGDMRDPSTRAISWLCLYTTIPFDFEKIETGKFPPQYLSINKKGRTPFINDNGFIVSEASSIMKYLCNVFLGHAVHSLYPDNLVARTKIDQYLDWHNTVLVPALHALFNSVVTPNAWEEQKARAAAEEALASLDRIWLSTPTISFPDLDTDKTTKNEEKSSEEGVEGAEGAEGVEKGEGEVEVEEKKEDKVIHTYVAGTRTPTIADFLAFCEVKQVQEWIPLCFQALPNVEGWLSSLQSLPGCEDSHVAYNQALDLWRSQRSLLESQNLGEKMAKL